MKILETERLELYQLTLSDDAFIYELVNSPGWLQFIGDRNVYSPEDAKRYIREVHLDMYQKHGFGLWRMNLRSTGAAIGLCGLLKRPFLEHADIGFASLPQYYRQGYTFEAGQAVLAYAFRQLKLPAITAITSPDNDPSRELLTKLDLNYQREEELPELGKCAVYSISSNTPVQE